MATQEGPFQNIRSINSVDPQPYFLAFQDGTVARLISGQSEFEATRTNSIRIPRPATDELSIFSYNGNFVVSAASAGAGDNPDSIVLFDYNLNQRDFVSFPYHRIRFFGPISNNRFLISITGISGSLLNGYYSVSFSSSSISIGQKISSAGEVGTSVLLRHWPGEAIDGPVPVSLVNIRPMGDGSLVGLRRIVVNSSQILAETDEDPRPSWWPAGTDWTPVAGETQSAELYRGAIFYRISSSGSVIYRLYPGSEGLFSSFYKINPLYNGNSMVDDSIILSSSGSILSTIDSPDSVTVGVEVSGRVLGGSYASRNFFVSPGSVISKGLYSTSPLLRPSVFVSSVVVGGGFRWAFLGAGVGDDIGSGFSTPGATSSDFARGEGGQLAAIGRTGYSSVKTRTGVFISDVGAGGRRHSTYFEKDGVDFIGVGIAHAGGWNA